MMPARLAELRALVDALGPGHWFEEDGDVRAEDPDGSSVAVCWTSADGKLGANQANARFIAAARDAAPELLAEVERLQEQVARVEAVRGELRRELDVQTGRIRNVHGWDPNRAAAQVLEPALKALEAALAPPAVESEP